MVRQRPLGTPAISFLCEPISAVECVLPNGEAAAGQQSCCASLPAAAAKGTIHANMALACALSRMASKGALHRSDNVTVGGPAPVRYSSPPPTACLPKSHTVSFIASNHTRAPRLFFPVLTFIQIVNARLRVVIEATASIRCSDETKSEEFTVRPSMFFVPRLMIPPRNSNIYIHRTLSRTFLRMFTLC
jgi:hypothetical protein